VVYQFEIFAPLNEKSTAFSITGRPIIRIGSPIRKNVREHAIIVNPKLCEKPRFFGVGSYFLSR